MRSGGFGLLLRRWLVSRSVQSGRVCLTTASGGSLYSSSMRVWSASNISFSAESSRSSSLRSVAPPSRGVTVTVLEAAAMFLQQPHSALERSPVAKN